ncbi:uncharacterized protein LOC127246570 [Andrographis paniculata]|uniref:uncharacterized protein LOC127246570 n=1 Tax=Andrographis paniculata TaxID=175694 RepID=UPI0021E8B0B2|nr:uncharacterized protein LOC127246570 [Andrographis paniculata]
MANFHIRSNSLPSNSHPVTSDVEDHLRRLRSSDGTSISVYEDLAILRDLQEGVASLIQMPSFQQALNTEGSEKWANELLEESLRLMDLCGFARDILNLSKGSIQELQSTIRRNRGESSIADVTNAYKTSRKTIKKTVNKFTKNFKSFNKNNSPFMGEDSDLKSVFEMLRETTGFGFSILKSVLMFLSGDEGSSKKRSWSLISMLTPTGHAKQTEAADMHNLLKKLKSTEVAIQEIEEELDAYYRTVVKARVSLLNALNH